MGEIVVLSSDDGMETMKNRGKSSEVVQWEKYLPKTVLRVLLVEYDDSTRQIISALLRKCCYKVVAVSDGLAAWEILKEKSHNIDLILTELDLPSISGFALLALVMEHEACKNIPVIMMSSQDSITMVLKCMLRGAADYLIKPMRKNELKNLWQHAWRRLNSLRSGPIAHAQSLPEQHLENTDETSADSRYHSDQRSGAQARSYNGHNKLMKDAKSLNEREESKDLGRVDKKLESFGVTMDLIGGIDNRPECVYGDNTRDEYIGPELGLSLKRSCSGSFENQGESKHQKLSLSDVSAFSRFENSKPEEKTVVALEASSSGEPKTPSESHEKLRKVRSDQGSATTSSNQENIGSSIMSGQCVQKDLSFRNQIPPATVTFTNQVQHPQDSPLPVESNRLKASKELEVGSQSTCNSSEVLAGQSSSTEKPKEEENVNVRQSWSRSQREAALMKFRMKRKDRCFDKKVRYQSRKKLAEQRPRVKGQFVRTVIPDSSTKA